MLLYILQGIKLRTSTESYAPVQNTTATSNLLYVRRLGEGEKELTELQRQLKNKLSSQLFSCCSSPIVMSFGKSRSRTRIHSELGRLLKPM